MRTLAGFVISIGVLVIPVSLIFIGAYLAAILGLMIVAVGLVLWLVSGSNNRPPDSPGTS